MTDQIDQAKPIEAAAKMLPQRKKKDLNHGC